MLTRAGIIATGDEVLNGEISNSNLQHIAQSLWNNYLPLGLQLQTSDLETDISCAVQWLMQQHKIIITIGGLGPTCDDRTRFAIANTLNCKLKFNVVAWRAINHYRLRRKLKPLAENNRQQAMFVPGCQILPNHFGTAAGMALQQQQQLIIMLPGPPHECIPMYERYALPLILQQLKPTATFRKKWTLTRQSESHLASLIEPELDKLDIQIGYRSYKPKLDIKISSNNKADFDAACAKIDEVLNKQ